MANINLSKAKNAKQNEFYTQYADIQKEVNAYLEYDPNVFRGKTVLLPCDDPEWSNFTKFFAQNFEYFGIKKLISTSYAPAAKSMQYGSLFSYAQENGCEVPDNERGRIFVLDHDTNKNGRIDIEDLEWKYLKGDGDFRSDEVKKLRDEADIIVTNPPFTLFREFLAWIMKAHKKFLVLGNKNSVTYKDVFPLIKDNKLWAGSTSWSKDMLFTVPSELEKEILSESNNGSKYRIIDDKFFARTSSVWYTNIEHGRRHQPLQLMSEEDNIKYSRHKEIRGIGYARYDNYDAIEVPFTDAIPSDYNGVMGVPISFLDKYCPAQFELLGVFNHGKDGPWDFATATVNGVEKFKRLAIRHRRLTKKGSKK